MASSLNVELGTFIEFLTNPCSTKRHFVINKLPRTNKLS